MKSPFPELSMKAYASLCGIAALLSLCVLPASAQEGSCEGWDAVWNPPLFESLTAEIVTACIRAGQDPNVRDNNNATPLHKASYSTRDPAVIAALLAGGADPNARNWDGMTALHTAASNNPNPAILVALVEGGADVNIRSADGVTPLHTSWRNDNPEVVHTLLTLGADPLARDDEGRVADPTNCEHWATAAFGRPAGSEAVSGCLEAGAEVGAGDDDGNTMLHHTARHGNLANLTLLLDAGADSGARNNDGTTPLHYAVSSANAGFVTLLLEAGADVSARNGWGVSPLHSAVRSNDLEIVTLLLDAGANVRVRDDSGQEPLHLAAGNPVIADVLLEAGADVDTRDNRNQTPLYRAMWSLNRAEDPDPVLEGWVVRLLALGADPNVHSSDLGWTPLYLAAFEKNAGMVTTLLSGGADPNARTRGDEIPLHPAAAYSNPAVVAALLEGGASVDAINQDGETPLHQAVTWDNPDNVAALLEAGADVQAANANGDTPLHGAASLSPRADRIERSLRLASSIVTMLVDAGADLNARNHMGETALHTAWKNDNEPVVRELLELGVDPEILDNLGRVAGPAVCDWSRGSFFRDAPLQSVIGCLGAGADPNAPAGFAGPPLFQVAGLVRNRESAPAVVVALVEAGADVNGRNEWGDTPLHSAMWGWGDKTTIVAALLEAGADVEARDQAGGTPLHRATAPSIISLLADAGADVNALDDRGRTPLLAALDGDRPATYEKLLELGAVPGIGTLVDPLDCALWNRAAFFSRARVAIVAGCIQGGADVNAGSAEAGSSPLHVAAGWARDPEVISVLVNAGADVEARDSRDQAPLHVAARTGTASVVTALLEAGADVNAWLHDFNVDYGWDYTPLHEAAGSNPDPAVASVLLEAGADPHARGTSARTPLHRAAAGNGNAAVIGLLLKAGADVNARASGGRMPLHEAAARNGNPEVIAALVAAGADVHAWGAEAHGIRWGGDGNTPDSWTPLHEAAAQNRNPAIVEALIEAGADVNVTAGDGSAPLYVAAAHYGTPAVVEALVRAGADISARDSRGWTPLHAAAIRNPVVFPRLLELGADPTVPDEEGRTPLDLARNNDALQGLEIVRRYRGSGGGESYSSCHFANCGLHMGGIRDGCPRTSSPKRVIHS